jgi:hypothetical protein
MDNMRCSFPYWIRHSLKGNCLRMMSKNEIDIDLDHHVLFFLILRLLCNTLECLQSSWTLRVILILNHMNYLFLIAREKNRIIGKSIHWCMEKLFFLSTRKPSECNSLRSLHWISWKVISSICSPFIGNTIFSRKMNQRLFFGDKAFILKMMLHRQQNMTKRKYMMLP